MLREILEALDQKKITLEDAEAQIAELSIGSVGDLARYDYDREKRSGVPEAIYAETKTVNEVVSITHKAVNKLGRVLITRVKEKHVKPLLELRDEGFEVDYSERGRCFIVKKANYSPEPLIGKIAIISAGTSDLPVAEEARVTAEYHGCEVIMVTDVGIAGLHRLFTPLKETIENGVQAIIVCAGMEGALPGVVAGIVTIPVIGVPTSVGHGVAAGGKTALFSMLTSCSPGLATVNIDSGFNAAVFATLIAKNAK